MKNLSEIKPENISFSVSKMFFTYPEFKKYIVQYNAKYRRNYKDFLLSLPFIARLSFLRGKFRFHKKSKKRNFLLPFQQHFLENRKDYYLLQDSLSDEQSRTVLYDLIYARFSGDFRPALSDSAQYFEKNIISFIDNEVFVDCGACTGDSIDSFLQENKKKSTCYVVEPDPVNMNRAKSFLSGKENVTLKFVEKGVSDQKEVLLFDASGNSGASFHDSPNSKTIELDTLDNMLDEPATFIKMDLEGFEEKALNGAKAQISNYHPTLAISIYHKPDDFIKLWKIIKSFDTANKYLYYIRHYSPQHNETILYAVKNQE